MECTLTPVLKSFSRKRDYYVSPGERARRDKANMERANKRRRRRIGQAVRGRGLNKMWTLTMDPKRQEKDVQQAVSGEISGAWSRWDRCRRRLKESLGKRLTFVVVPELHKSGAIHFHMATDQYVTHAEMERCWGVGFVWVTKLSGRKLTNYLAKYLTKALEELPWEPGQRAYAVSQGIYTVIVEWQQGFETKEEAISLLFALVGAEGYWWQADDAERWYVNNFND